MRRAEPAWWRGLAGWEGDIFYLFMGALGLDYCESFCPVEARWLLLLWSRLWAQGLQELWYVNSVVVAFRL